MKQASKVARDAEICTRYLNGEKLQTIAVAHQVTAERVRQIVRAAGLSVEDQGRSVREAGALAGTKV